MNPRLLIALIACAPLAAAGENLTQVYQDARGYDAQYGAARQALQAGLERLPQGRALLLPSLNLTANTTRSHLESDSKDETRQPSFERDVNSYGYALTFTQPLYRRQNWLQADQGERRKGGSTRWLTEYRITVCDAVRDYSFKA